MPVRAIALTFQLPLQQQVKMMAGLPLAKQCFTTGQADQIGQTDQLLGLFKPDVELFDKSSMAWLSSTTGNPAGLDKGTPWREWFVLMVTNYSRTKHTQLTLEEPLESIFQFLLSLALQLFFLLVNFGL